MKHLWMSILFKDSIKVPASFTVSCTLSLALCCLFVQLSDERCYKLHLVSCVFSPTETPLFLYSRS